MAYKTPDNYTDGPLSVERLKMNRWAESLSISQWQRIYPKVAKSKLPYIWNELSQDDRAKVFKKWSVKFGTKGLVSNVKMGDGVPRIADPQLIFANKTIAEQKLIRWFKMLDDCDQFQVWKYCTKPTKVFPRPNRRMLERWFSLKSPEYMENVKLCYDADEIPKNRW